MSQSMHRGAHKPRYKMPSFLAISVPCIMLQSGDVTLGWRATSSSKKNRQPSDFVRLSQAWAHIASWNAKKFEKAFLSRSGVLAVKFLSRSVLKILIKRKSAGSFMLRGISLLTSKSGLRTARVASNLCWSALNIVACRYFRGTSQSPSLTHITHAKNNNAIQSK